MPCVEIQGCPILAQDLGFKLSCLSHVFFKMAPCLDDMKLLQAYEERIAQNDHSNSEPFNGQERACWGFERARAANTRLTTTGRPHLRGFARRRWPWNSRSSSQRAAEVAEQGDSSRESQSQINHKNELRVVVVQEDIVFRNAEPSLVPCCDVEIDVENVDLMQRGGKSKPKAVRGQRAGARDQG